MEQPGRSAYRGFEYQIRVSAWLALVFLAEKKFAEEVEVEPLSGEDLEVLQRGDAEKDTSERTTKLTVEATSQRRYIVQIKGRRAGHWKAGELAEILKGPGRGADEDGSSRVWPIEVMRADPDAALLFVTTTTVADGLTWFLVDSPAFAPRSESRPNAAKYWGKSLPDVEDSVLARVGVLDGMRHEYIEKKIDDILASELHVPYARRGECRDALLARIRAAMLDGSVARVRVDEIHALAKKHDGLPGGPDPFVMPKNWANIQQFLCEKHAIVLLGEPGVGKTTAADQLVYEHQILPESFRVVRPQRPSDLRRLSEVTERVIVYVEDPFGRYQRRDDDDEWLLELERFCSKVRDDLKLVVTSRATFADRYLDDAQKTPRLRRHRFEFGEDAFDRHALLQQHLDMEESLDPGARAWITSNEDTVVQYLSRPFSYSVFVPRAAAVRPEHRSTRSLKQIAQEASTAELGKELEKTFENEPEGVLRGLAAVWLALESWPYEPRLEELLTQLEEALLDIEAEVSGAKTKLIEHRWLRERDGTLRMHPIYLEACLHVIETKKALTTRVVESVLRAYVTRRQINEVEAVFRAVTGRAFVREGMRQELSKFALDVLRSSASAKGRSKAFESALTILAASDQSDNPIVALVSGLCRSPLVRRRRNGLFNIEEWSPPPWASDVVMHKRVAEHPDTPTIVRAFIRQGFPGSGDWSGGESSLVDFFYGLADVSAAFDAILNHIGEFSAFLVDVIAFGAACSKNADFERLVERACAEERAYHAWVHDLYPYDEDSDAASEHFGDLADERIRPARALIDAVLDVQALLGDQAWAAGRREPIVFERFAERVKWRKERDDVIIRQVFQACPSKIKGDLIEAMLANEALFDSALSLLPETPINAWRRILSLCFPRHYSPDDPARQLRVARIIDVVRASSPTLSFYDRVSLAYALHGDEDYSPLYDIVVGHLVGVEREALAVLLAEPGASTQGCVTLLEQLIDSESLAGQRALVALAHDGYPVDDRIVAWLSPAGDIEKAVAALDAAEATRSLKNLERARQGLTHPRADVRKRALALLGEMPGEEAIDAILSACDDPTGSVRVAVAEALAGRAEARAWLGLVKLLADTTDMSGDALQGYAWYDDHEPYYQVAITAARALLKLDPWAEELSAAVSGFLMSASSTRSDVARVLRGRTSL